MALVIIAKNTTTLAIELSSLGITIPALNQRTMTETLLAHDVMSDPQLQTLVDIGDIVLNVAGRDLTADEVLNSWAGHGVQGGGDLHALATQSLSGFMSFVDKIKIDGIVGGGTSHGILSDLLVDDHTQYQLRIEKDAAGGYAGLDAGGMILSSAVPPHSTIHDFGGPDTLIVQSLGSGAGGPGFIIETDGAGGWNLIPTPAGGGGGGPHAATHSAAGSDPILAQNLGSGASASGFVLETDGAGGWNLIATPAGGGGGPHAATHSMGGADPITAQNLSSGVGPAGFIMVTDGSGGWNLASSPLTDHGALTGLGDDDHPQYQLRTEENVVNGYAGLDGSGEISSSVHGSQPGGTQHSVSSSSAAGFKPQSNLASAANPTATDDNTAGYGAGSTWVNLTTDESFVCVDAATSTAVWKSMTAAAVGSGENNTASNVGAGGVGFFSSKVGIDLQFRNLNAASGKLTVALDAPNKEIDIDVVDSSIDHDLLLNFVGNEHVDHTAVSISTSEGIQGGGDISATRSLKLDVNGLTVDGSPDLAADYIVTFDASAGTHKKVLLNNLGTSDHGGLVGLGDDDHAQYHNDARGDARYLKRTAADFTTFTEKVTPVAGDILLIEDSADSDNKKKIQVSNLLGGGGAFGADYQSAVSLVRSTTTDTGFQTKAQLVTAAVTGTFRIGWTAVVDNGTKLGHTRLRNITDGADIGPILSTKFSADEFCDVSGFAEIVMGGVSKTLEIQWRNDIGSFTQGIQAVRIEFWRIS